MFHSRPRNLDEITKTYHRLILNYISQMLALAIEEKRRRNKKHFSKKLNAIKKLMDQYTEYHDSKMIDLKNGSNGKIAIEQLKSAAVQLLESESKTKLKANTSTKTFLDSIINIDLDDPVTSTKTLKTSFEKMKDTVIDSYYEVIDSYEEPTHDDENMALLTNLVKIIGDAVNLELKQKTESGKEQSPDLLSMKIWLDSLVTNENGSLSLKNSASVTEVLGKLQMQAKLNQDTYPDSCHRNNRHILYQAMAEMEFNSKVNTKKANETFTDKIKDFDKLPLNSQEHLCQLRRVDLIKNINTVVSALLEDETLRGKFKSRGLTRMKRLLERYNTSHKALRPKTTLFNKPISEEKVLQQLQKIAENRLKWNFKERSENKRGELYEMLNAMDLNEPSKNIKALEGVKEDIDKKLEENQNEIQSKSKKASSLSKRR